MIRIRFFGPGELIQTYFRAARYEWINGQKPHLLKKWYSNTVQHRKLRSDRGSWFVNEFFLFKIHDTVKAGD